MYQEYFGLNSKPFGIVPDTRFLFLSDSHKEAIAHLVYALNEKNGFVQLTGEVGVGKTMACRYILANMPEDIDVALILNPRIDELSLLSTLCKELGLNFSSQQKSNDLTELINTKLLETYADGRHTILIIDEAQNLPKRTLEQIRLLTNLETDTQKLLRIILIGQPELGELLAEHDMRQVAQRITSRYHLESLGANETDEYIHHRLKVAGCERRLFSKAAIQKIHSLTDGTPRLINLICDRALIGAYSMGVNEVTPTIIKQAAKEALPFIKTAPQNAGLRWLAVLALLGLMASTALVYRDHWQPWLTQQWQKTSYIEPAQVKPAAEASVNTVDLRETQPNELTPANSTTLTTPSPDQIETLKKQADVEFRLGIPSQL